MISVMSGKNIEQAKNIPTNKPIEYFFQLPTKFHNKPKVINASIK